MAKYIGLKKNKPQYYVGLDKKVHKVEEDDIAPVKSTKGSSSKSNTSGDNALTALMKENKSTSLKGNRLDDLGPVRASFEPNLLSTQLKRKEQEKNASDERTWFQKGAFEDGYQKGDVKKTTIASATDLGENASSGILGMGERIVDALAWLAPAYNASQQQNFDIKQYRQEQQWSKEFIEKDLYDEEQIAKKIITNPIEKRTGIDVEKNSVFGEKSDALAQSGGQLLATAGLTALGVPWWITTGSTAFGGEVENAFAEGATYGEAGASAAISAGAEILTEKLSGGIKFGGKTLDDVMLKPLTEKISNKAVKALANVGIDAVGEGTEEVVSSVMSNLGSALYKEENVGEILTSEEALDEYIESFIGGAVLGGASSSFQNLRNGDEGNVLTENEQKVIDKEVENRIAEEEKDGTKLTAKEKAAIKKNVLQNLEKGYISIDTIESVLGGETYDSYKSITDEETSLQTEYDTLKDLEDDTLTDDQRNRKAELELLMEDLKNTSNKTQLQEQLSREVEELAKSDRLSEAYNERARKKQAFEADVTKYEGKAREFVQKTMDTKVLNNTNRSHDFVDLLAKLVDEKDLDLDLTNNQRLKDSGFAIEGKIVNGYQKGSTIGINIDSAKALNKVVGHEITHVLEGTDAYAELQNAVMEYAKTKGEYRARVDEIINLYKGQEGANLKNELTADLVGDYLFTDSDFINNLSTSNPNIFKRVYEEIKYLAKVATAGSKEARELEKLKKTFSKVWKENTSNDQNDVRYKFDMSEDTALYQYIEDALSGKLPKKSYHKLSDSISERLATDIENIVGFSVKGYGNEISPGNINHINNDHGANGKSDKSMSNLHDLAKINYVIENYDKIREGKASKEYKNRDGSNAKTIELQKKIDDGYYYVVEAVPDAKLRTLHVVSAYKNKNDAFSGVPVANAPRRYVQDEPQSNASFYNDSIPKNEEIATPKENLSLSQDVDDIAPVGNKTYGKDIKLEDIAPVREDVQNTVSEDGIAPVAETAIDEDIAPVADQASVDEDIAPVAEQAVSEPVQSEGKRLLEESEKIFQSMFDSDDIAPVKALTAEEEQKQIAKTMDVEPKTESERNSRKVAILRANIEDKGAVFEDLSLKAKNRELMGKWNFTLYSEARAQRLMRNGRENVKSLDEIQAEVENTGQVKEFYEYVYHKHNVDRMSLQKNARAEMAEIRKAFPSLDYSQIAALARKRITSKTSEGNADIIRKAKEVVRLSQVKDKAVFGDSVTAEVSQEIVDKYENTKPAFKDYAQDVYNYMNYLRQQLVDNGVISQETADKWSAMYPHYVPIRRLGDTGLNINVPLHTGRTGISAPIKKAVGGNADILPLFGTMATRTLQTYKAIAKNSFGVELKNTLGTVVENTATSVDEVIDGIETQESLLQEGEKGKRPTFTVFENGEKVTYEITKDMYDALNPISESSILSKTFKPLNIASNIHRGLLTEYNPVFMLTNAIKDTQDILINSQHPVKTYLKVGEAHKQMLTKGYWYNEYMDNGGDQNTYFDSETNTFKTENKGLSKILDTPPFSTISKLNNYIEMIPRLAEYIASREAGRSIEVSMLDAARVTTNFKAGGDLTKFLNRNGAGFLNASVQGAMQQVRNVREAKANGLKGWASLATKFALASLPAVLLNNFVWDDDEEYEELSDYVKQNYYVIGKYDDGKFIRIPKGRTVAVIQEAVEQISNAATGDDEVDLKSFLDLVVSNLAPNNPIENNILAPIMQVKNNETWYGEDLVPARLQDLPAAEQFDESTDSFSKFLGEKLDVSPVKINYLLDQYSGGVGDVVLPMLTPEAESGDDTVLGNITAPLKSKFTTDSVMNNQYVSDFYDMSEELTTNAKKSDATDEDVLKNKYFNSINSKMSELYSKKREIQNSNLSNNLKYEQVRDVQKQIDSLAEEALNTYENVSIEGNYATVGDVHYKLSDEYEWTKITDKQLEKQNEVTKGLNISPGEYWNNKDEYDYAYEYPEKYAVAKSVGGYEAYTTYSKELYSIKSDKDRNGKSISGSRKSKVIEYINNLDADYETKMILFKSEYNADDTYNYEIIDYLNSREDISYSEMETILKELGFTVKADGTIEW